MKGRGNSPRRVALKEAIERKKEKQAWERLDKEDVEDVAAKPHSSRRKSVSRKPAKKQSPHEEMQKAFKLDKLLPTPAWDALFASTKRDFVRIVLEGLAEPWDPQAIFDFVKATLFDGNLPDVDAKYDHAYFELHPTWGATTTFERSTGKVLRIRVNPRLGEPGSRETLITAIVHEALHVAVARDGKFSATVAHGLDFGLYSALAQDKTGLEILAAWDDAEIDLTLTDRKNT